jgi:DNA-binding NtrC family response regulator
MSAPPDDDESDFSTIAQHRFVPSPLPAASFVFRVVDGPDVGAALTLDGDQPLRTFIGHGPACALRLSDRTVSRRHVAVEIAGDRARITDLGSANGTLVNHVPIVDAFLLGGETVDLGGTSLRIEKHAAKPVAPPPIVGFGRLVGMSYEMQRLYPLCARLANADLPLVIEGETGTGKEVLAESLHESGRRVRGPYVVFDCTAVPPNLVESELFGHERGAFTGAVATRKGVFEQADGGTLLIDEIGDLELSLQAKLLRAVERSEVRRVGGDRAIQVDVRVLAATRRDLDREVQSGRFRDDLFHRLAVARIELPPLRRRKGDVPLLVDHFRRTLGGGAIPTTMIARWEDYDWPGNVRELRNAVARWLALGESVFPEEDAGRVSAGAAPDPGRAPSPGGALSDFIEGVLEHDLPIERARRHVIDHFERRYIARVLAAHDGDVARAAEASGIARRHFNRIRARGKE